MLRVKNKTLSRLFRDAEAKAKWIGKLHKNAGRTLNRIGNLVTLDPASLAPPKDGKNRLTLVYIGGEFDTDKPRIESVLGARFDGDVATVQFSRIVAEVTLKKLA